MSELDHEWYQMAFTVYDVPIIAEAKSRANSQFFKDNHVFDMAKPVRELENFLRSKGLRIESITVKDL